MDEILNVTQNFCEELLKRLGVTAEVSVLETGDEEDKIITVNINGDDLGVLIGYHGEHLSAIQTILALMVFQKTGERKTVIVDAGGYQGEKVARLEDIAIRAAEKARFLASPVALPPMSSYERRIVHLKVEQLEGVLSESEGEGWDRHVIIKPR
jgi:spoIIIJ-associated protein